MATEREAINDHALLVETAKMPSHIPDVDEVGATSAPLLSAAYFIGARCKPYGDDFLLCKKEANATGEIDCLKEGRRVTRCAVSVLEDINKHCLEEFRMHWQCLEQQSHQLWGCRPAEKLLNKCVFDKLNLEKKIPGLRADEPQIHLKEKPLLRPNTEDFASLDKYNAAKKAGQI
jgi:NADH dehydrogenase (ubiquinone) 1 alpha subcomplex subunit 8